MINSVHILLRRALIGAAVMACFISLHIDLVLAQTMHIYPKNKSVAYRHVIEKFSDIDWERVLPGDVIIIHGDDSLPYIETFTIRANGSARDNIIIKAAEGEAPIIEAPVFFVNASYVRFDGITVRKSGESGVNIKDGSHNIVISGCKIYSNKLGICIEASGGMGNVLKDNEIYSNDIHGIGVDVANCVPGKETIIAKNKIYSNGYHGIEVNGCFYIVEENVVHNNGMQSSGTSGIHTYARNAEQEAGDHNIIRYNISYSNRDGSGQDGNGIQLDQWCDYNQVYYNICYGNDGAGINIFDSANSTIYNNSLFGNMIDPGRSHRYRAEIILASDYVHNVDHVKNVKVFNNIIVSDNPDGYCIYVDDLTSKNALEIGNNAFFHTKSRGLYFWDNSGGVDIKKWNRLKPVFKTDIYIDPSFKIFPPCKIEDFELEKGSSCIGKGIFAGQERDLLGSKIDKTLSLGALEYSKKYK